MVAADARTAIVFSLSPGNDHDGPHGRALLEELGPMPESLPLLMDRAYEGNETRQLVLDLGMIPIVPPKSNRLQPWEYDRALYKKRNEIERLFRRLKGFRRIFSRFEKLDVVFLAFLSFALIVEALRISVNTP
jgi:transposase